MRDSIPTSRAFKLVPDADATSSSGHRVVLHDRRQMPVGQGGFHVGGLQVIEPEGMFVPPFDALDRFGDADFLYVYDCGSEPKRLVHREINALLAHRPERRLDLLFLSHFDRDHICGTPHLLRKRGGFRVDTIVMPYVDDAERIVALARAADAVEQRGGRIDSFFVDMVVDPMEALSRFQPRQIIFVRGGDDGLSAGDVGGPDGFPRSDPDGQEARSRTFWKLTPASPDSAMMVTTLSGGAARTKLYAVSDAAIAVHDDSRSLAWKLLPYVKPVPRATILKFRAAVETELGWSKGSFLAQIANPDVRRQMATTKRTKLAKAYKSTFTDKNLTSMSLYSGPLEPDGVEVCALTPNLSIHPLSKVGWVGTGDAPLREPADIAAFKHAFSADLPYVSTFVFPHHGSIENSDPDNLVSDADVWVAAADPIHAWAHPHYKLEAAVDKLKAEFRHVRAWPKTAYDECFLIVPPRT